MIGDINTINREGPWPECSGIPSQECVELINKSTGSRVEIEFSSPGEETHGFNPERVIIVIDIRHGKKPVVCSESGSVAADAVLIAGNAYSQLEPKRLSGLVYPAGSYIIATEPLATDVAESINRQDLAVCDLNTVVDYFRLSADKRLLYGGACNYSGRDPSDIEAYIRPRMVSTYPQLADVRVEYQWGGKIGIVLDRVLSVGCLNGNVYYCQGYCGHGVSASHAMGEGMADAIGGSLERYDLFAGMKHIRLPGSRWFGNQVIALGMLYYKLRDAL